MTTVPTHISEHQLRSDSTAVLRAVENGETFIVTNNGRPVAEIGPIQVDPLAGLDVRRATPHARFADLRPPSIDADETALEALMFLRGDR